MRYLFSFLTVVAVMGVMIAITPTPALAQATLSSSSWNSLEVAKLVVSGTTPLIVAFVGVLIGYLVNTRLKQDEKEIEQQREKQEELKQKSYLYMELSIDCQFFGPRQNQFIANFSVIATNRGPVSYRFPEIRLRVLGIKDDESFQPWNGREPRIYFPHKLFDIDVVPPDWNFIEFGPGVTHKITFATTISADFSYLLARSGLKYREFTPQSAEAVFATPKVQPNYSKEALPEAGLSNPS